MASGFGAYGQVLADPRARWFSFAGLIARMPVSMTGLGIVLLISIETGSFGRAGIVTGVATVCGAVTAPAWGRLIDRVGQAKVLLTAAIIANVSLSLLILTVLNDLPLLVTLATAVGVGLGFSSAGSAVRARWTHRLKGDPLLNTAYALEAVVDEVVFILGPVLVTVLATSVNPALGLAVCVVLGSVGAVALACQRGTQPPVRTVEERRQPAVPLSGWLLVPIVIACACLGGLFGGMEVVVVAFATEAGILKYAGFIMMAWASGSLVAGLVTGTIAWKVSPEVRFRVGAVALAISILPLPFVSQPALVAGLLIVSGLAIAPTLIASVAVTQAAVSHSRLTEALAWTSTGMAGGVALGAAALGQVIDHWGARAGFVGVVGIGVLLILAALCVRTGRPRASSGHASSDDERAVTRR